MDVLILSRCCDAPVQETQLMKFENERLKKEALKFLHGCSKCGKPCGTYVKK